LIPWEKPWKTPRYAGGPFPRNFYTGKPYRGINVLLLWSSEYSSQFWLTFKQAQASKGNVRKGEHGTQSYDPRRLQGVTVYRDDERRFAQGDRVQMTAPYHEQKLANRELGMVEQIDRNGNLKLKMDSGREVEFNVRQHPHLDYGYAVTSHSSQGQTADRVLIHVDSAEAHGELLNSRMAYVSVSRAQFEVKIYTNDAKTLGQELSRDVTKATALQEQSVPRGQNVSQSVKPQSVRVEISQGLSVG
jgi:hypothetical protein